MATNTTDSTGLHTDGSLDKKISFAFIGTLVMQLGLGVWWAATMSADIAGLKHDLETASTNRYTSVEARLVNAATIRRISKLENLTVSQNLRLRDLEMQIYKYIGGGHAEPRLSKTK